MNNMRAIITRAIVGASVALCAIVAVPDLTFAAPDCNLKRNTTTTANLSGCNLIGANLILADLSGANLEGANLFGADLEGADLTDVIGYTRWSPPLLPPWPVDDDAPF